MNFANKWEIIILIRNKKNRNKFLEKMSGEKKSGKILVVKKKVGKTFPDLFSPDQVTFVNHL